MQLLLQQLQLNACTISSAFSSDVAFYELANNSHRSVVTGTETGFQMRI